MKTADTELPDYESVHLSDDVGEHEVIGIETPENA